ncbi:MAG: GGDEF domain-containing protein [Gammaproteobacteria bacterium]|nr:GGDEF domain-containing protein [Gammaproteobacteria bacterium]
MFRLFKNQITSLTSYGFGAVLLISFTIVLLVLWQLDDWNQSAFKLVEQGAEQSELTHIMRDAIRGRELIVQRMLNMDDVFERENESLKFFNMAGRYASAREQIMQMDMSTEMQLEFKLLDEAVNYAEPYNNNLVNALLQGNLPPGDIDAIHEDGRKAIAKVIAILDKMVGLQRNQYQKEVSAYKQSRKKILIITAIFFVISIIVALFVIRLSSQRYKYVSRLSIIDGLTGLYNRRYFDMIMEEEWKRSMRDYTPISLLMLDIDFFKAYNDKYGHQMGDICLYSIAQILGGQLKRASDFTARYGGEEFVMVLPNTNAENARLMAERLRRAVEEARIQAGREDVSPWITISIGVATTIAEFGQLSSVLVSAADKCLYESKRAGRNRVTDVNLVKVE